MITILLWYIIISYFIGFALFLVEMKRGSKLLEFGIILLFLSPLTAWHGVLHYMAVYWHRFKGTPFEPWI